MNGRQHFPSSSATCTSRCLRMRKCSPKRLRIEHDYNKIFIAVGTWHRAVWRKTKLNLQLGYRSVCFFQRGGDLFMRFLQEGKKERHCWDFSLRHVAGGHLRWTVERDNAPQPELRTQPQLQTVRAFFKYLRCVCCWRPPCPLMSQAVFRFKIVWCLYCSLVVSRFLLQEYEESRETCAYCTWQCLLECHLTSQPLYLMIDAR